MATLRLMAWTAVAFAASISVCYSGPCTTEIARMRARIDAKVEAKAGTGQSIQESGYALMHRQPTLGSITAAAEKAGDLSPRKVDALAKSMARAVAADAARDKNGCEKGTRVRAKHHRVHKMAVAEPRKNFGKIFPTIRAWKPATLFLSPARRGGAFFV